MPSGRIGSTIEVFEAIISTWIAHLADIERLVLRVEEEKENWKHKSHGRRQWSFEEELNRWAREGCRATTGWESRENCRNVYPGGLIPDAVVTTPECEPVLVEIKAVTNVTMDKWIDFINEDTHKLTTESPYPGLQIVACFDTFDLETAEDWISWLARIQIWNKDTPMIRRQPLSGSGKMLVKGWAITPNSL